MPLFLWSTGAPCCLRTERPFELMMIQSQLSSIMEPNKEAFQLVDLDPLELDMKKRARLQARVDAAVDAAAVAAASATEACGVKSVAAGYIDKVLVNTWFPYCKMSKGCYTHIFISHCS